MWHRYPYTSLLFPSNYKYTSHISQFSEIYNVAEDEKRHVLYLFRVAVFTDLTLNIGACGGRCDNVGGGRSCGGLCGGGGKGGIRGGPGTLLEGGEGGECLLEPCVFCGLKLPHSCG